MKSKRVLSLVLALVMVLGTFGTVFADEPVEAVEPVEVEEIIEAIEAPEVVTHGEKIQWLIDEGIIVGDETGDLKLEASIDRASVAKMVVEALDQTSVAEGMKNYKAPFVDVAVNNWSNGNINVVAVRELMQGNEKKEFMPLNQISYAEVLTILVRMMDEEIENPIWPTSYILKAQDLGILADVDMPSNYMAAANRKDIFEMFYNAMMNMEVGNYKIVKGIVLENHRVESLNKDVVIVEVIKEVQEANYAGASRNEAGDQLDLTVAIKGEDVESLLGKMGNFTINEKNQIIKFVSEADVITGAITASERRLTVAGRTYTVEMPERYRNSDERIFRSYLNNEGFEYADYYQEPNWKAENKDDKRPTTFSADFARVTVKNGKVLFIDSYNFDDVAPVAKDIDEKNRVAYYDDVKDGELDELTVGSSAYVINVVNGEMHVGNNEEITKEDVIHWYGDVRRNLTVFVRPAGDNVVEGTYKEATARRAKGAADIVIRVDDKDYDALIDSKNRNPVYSTLASEHDYYALTDSYDEELAAFKDEEVVLTLDMFGNVQSISAETIDGRFYAVVSDTSRSHGEIKLLKIDNKSDWYGTDRTTNYTLEGAAIKGTQDSKFDDLKVNDLLLVTSGDELLTNVDKFERDSLNVEAINKDVIDFGEGTTEEDGYYYIGKKTALFVAIDGKAPVAMTAAEFIRDYHTNFAAEDSKGDARNPDVVEGYVIVDGRRDSQLARVIVITKAEKVVKDAKSTTLVAKVTDVTIRGNKYFLKVINADGERTTHEVTNADAIKELTSERVVANSIVTLKLTDNDDKDVVAITEEINEDGVGLYKVVKTGRERDRRERYVTLTDKEEKTNKTFWIKLDADVFGEVAVGNYVAVKDGALDKAYRLLDLIDVRPLRQGFFAEWDGTTDTPELPEGAVKYNGTVALDGNAYIVLGEETYPFTGEIPPAGVEVGDMVVPTFVTIRGEVVVTKVEKVVAPVDPDLVDKAALSALILDAKALNETDYHSGWDLLLAAILSAEAVVADEDATQAQVDAEVIALQAAIDGLVAVVVPGVEVTFTPINEVAGIISGEVTINGTNLDPTADKFTVTHFAGTTPIKLLSEATDLFPLPASGKVDITIYAADGTTVVHEFENVELIVKK